MIRILLVLLTLLAAPAFAQSADSVSLDGAWRFHAGDATAWASPSLDDRAWTTLRVPAPWEDGIGDYNGYGWYRREVRLPDGLRGAPLGLRFGTVGDAFEVYWNGVRVGTRGGMPPDFMEGVVLRPFFIPDSVLDRAVDGRHVVAVRVYNAYAYGGLMTPVLVARYDTLASRRSPRSVVVGGLVSFFLAIGVYHLAFWLRRRAARENLLFAAVCLCVCVYGSTYAEPVQGALIPVMHPYRVGLLSLLAGGPAYVALVNRLFGLRGGRRTRLVHGAFAAAFAVGLVLPLPRLAEFNQWIDGALVMGLVTVVVRAWKASRPGSGTPAPHARTLLLGTAAFSVSLAYDLLSEYFAFIPVARVLPGLPGVFWIGFFVFLMAVGTATAGQWALTEVAALVDPLTELSRRHVLEDALRRESGRLRRTGGSLALVMIDLDHFKRINDTHGHRVGDQVLARVGRLLRSSARNLDLPARFGGEEFAVLLYDTDLAGALAFCERFRANLAEMRVPVAGGAAVQVTASMGVSVGSDLVDPDALVEVADRALYQAKGEGRDRLVSARVEGPDRVMEYVPRPGLQGIGNRE
ncbi:diguanylate cyclase [Longimicrobium sp.]|uniref:GGDEF domain-containing protein n=1 Tax=Longimicrobium sp. TaxID=2029185 RepID=UPI002E2F55B0|nr:diguanylate cyclase [Longimicrobium sp.]HEX6040151.1 diguanylate cyclase [Longimicrobium sp.]